jgi:starch phosphorylase
MLPASLSGLEILAFNLWWSWDTDATELWESIDPWRWANSRHNPVAMLADVEPSRWADLAADARFTARLASVLARFETYIATPDTWCRGEAAAVHAGGVGYFCMEFGIHESLRIYSGGLGVLAGDFLKSSSDLGIPLTGIGLMYRKGYFRQFIDDGKQAAAFPTLDYARMPARLVLDAAKKPLILDIPIAHHLVQAQIWRVDVGRVRLYLLDTDLDSNSEADRQLTYQLYGGDQDTRIRQEVILGIGGVKALRALHEDVAVYHMNEGHCAFATLELLRERLATGDSLDEATAWVRAHCAFTTHTPVPAGHDRFPGELVEKILGTWAKQNELPQSVIATLGRVHPADQHEHVCMTVLALKLSGKANGVSALHGEVSREMWHSLWPTRPVDQVPIGHITNGVHPFFWMAPEARALFDAHLPRWRSRTWEREAWAGVESIPAKALWDLRNRLRARMIEKLAHRTGRHLDPHTLTIGFARRFAPYKRGDLAFREPERLERLLATGPVQLVYSGKAHPADIEGQKILAEVVKWASQSRFRDRVLFVEDYDIAVGHSLTSGCDIWLNNPRRPQEASGTSGQKVILNGGLNLSILDGWWAEGWDGTNGWAIAAKPERDDLEAQDEADAEALYRVLENEVVPAWKFRDDGIPTAWIDRIRRSIATCAPAFNTHRMMRDYALDMYAPLISTVSHTLA